MSNQPLSSPPPAPQARSRRADRTPGRRKKKRSKGFPLWQWLVLALLTGCLAYAFFSLREAGSSLSRLQAEREAERERYEQTVRAHAVRYRDLIERYAAQYQLNPAYVSAIIMQESGYDPRAVSSKGAMGLMQFMPSTFEWVAPNCGISKKDTDAVYEPEKAIRMGCYLLRYICDKLGSDDPVLVACAYHAGWGTVPAWLNNYSTDGKTLTVAQIPKADTRTYAGRVLNSYAIYLQHYYESPGSAAGAGALLSVRPGHNHGRQPYPGHDLSKNQLAEPAHIRRKGIPVPDRADLRRAFFAG